MITMITTTGITIGTTPRALGLMLKEWSHTSFRYSNEQGLYLTTFKNRQHGELFIMGGTPTHVRVTYAQGYFKEINELPMTIRALNVYTEPTLQEIICNDK